MIRSMDISVVRFLQTQSFRGSFFPFAWNDCSASEVDKKRLSWTHQHFVLLVPLRYGPCGEIHFLHFVAGNKSLLFWTCGSPSPCGALTLRFRRHRMNWQTRGRVGRSNRPAGQTREWHQSSDSNLDVRLDYFPPHSSCKRLEIQNSKSNILFIQNVVFVASRLCRISMVEVWRTLGKHQSYFHISQIASGCHSLCCAHVIPLWMESLFRISSLW